MTTRPIIFNADMVRAILDGRKRQTRRVVKPQPPFGCEYAINGNHSHAACYSDEVVDGAAVPRRVWVPPTPTSTDHRLACPYGKPGETLWVRETWFYGYVEWDGERKDPSDGTQRVFYAADQDGPEHLDDGDGWPVLRKNGTPRSPWKPSIHMPRKHSRITLQITGVRVERVQEISIDDMEAEGVYEVRHATDDDEDTRQNRGRFADLWNSINDKKGYGWDANPYVWVIEFERFNTTPANGGKEEG